MVLLYQKINLGDSEVLITFEKHHVNTIGVFVKV